MAWDYRSAERVAEDLDRLGGRQVFWSTGAPVDEQLDRPPACWEPCADRPGGAGVRQSGAEGRDRGAARDEPGELVPTR